MILYDEDEFNAIGIRNKLPWWNSNILSEPHLLQLVLLAKRRRRDAGLRTELANLIPFAEYLAVQEDLAWSDVFESKRTWLAFVEANHSALGALLTLHSMQECTPNHTALVIDYLAHMSLLEGTTNTVIELGCSAGILGGVFEQYRYLFGPEESDWARKHYFTLNRLPALPPDVVRFQYIGVDYALPRSNLIPYFSDSCILREKLGACARDIRPSGVLIEQPAGRFLEAERVLAGGSIIYLTARSLRRFEDPCRIAEELMRLVATNRHAHWLDISELHDLRRIEDRHCPISQESNDTFLSHNGEPVARIKGNGTECIDWEYL